MTHIIYRKRLNGRVSTYSCFDQDEIDSVLARTKAEHFMLHETDVLSIEEAKEYVTKNLMLPIDDVTCLSNSKASSLAYELKILKEI